MCTNRSAHLRATPDLASPCEQDVIDYSIAILDGKVGSVDAYRIWNDSVGWPLLWKAWMARHRCDLVARSEWIYFRQSCVIENENCGNVYLRSGCGGSNLWQQWRNFMTISPVCIGLMACFFFSYLVFAFFMWHAYAVQCPRPTIFFVKGWCVKNTWDTSYCYEITYDS